MLYKLKLSASLTLPRQQGRLSLSTDGAKCAVDNFRGNFIRGLKLSFNIQIMVNFVADVSVEFSVDKNAYSHCCQ